MYEILKFSTFWGTRIHMGQPTNAPESIYTATKLISNLYHWEKYILYESEWQPYYLDAALPLPTAVHHVITKLLTFTEFQISWSVLGHTYASLFSCLFIMIHHADICL